LFLSLFTGDITQYFGLCTPLENQVQEAAPVQTDQEHGEHNIPSPVIPPMPKGWKPGDPIHLPPPPKGWKPGDPIYPLGGPASSPVEPINAHQPMFDLDLNPDLTVQSQYDTSDSENDRDVEWE